MLFLCGAQARKEQEQSKANEEPIRRCLHLGPREKETEDSKLELEGAWIFKETLQQWSTGRGKDALPLLEEVTISCMRGLQGMFVFVETSRSQDEEEEGPFRLRI